MWVVARAQPPASRGHTSSFSPSHPPARDGHLATSQHLPGAPSPGLLTALPSPPLGRYTVESRAPERTALPGGAVEKTRPRLFTKQLQQPVSHNPNPGSSTHGPSTSVSQAWPWPPFTKQTPLPAWVKDNGGTCCTPTPLLPSSSSRSSLSFWVLGVFQEDPRLLSRILFHLSMGDGCEIGT